MHVIQQNKWAYRHRKLNRVMIVDELKMMIYIAADNRQHTIE